MPTTQDPRQTIRHFLDRFDKPTRLLVAISGGSDSLGLLHLLHTSLSQTSNANVSLAAATVDHALRPEAADEALAVSKLCRTLAIPHVTRRWVGEKPQTGISAAAREARYALLAEAAAELQADAIVTGHTRDDQIETIAMRAARSSDDTATGLAGMADAMLYDRRIWILRPLLDCHRADIRAALNQAGLGWADDPSNDDHHYERVRMRQSIADGREIRLSPEGGNKRRLLGQSAAELLDRHATAYRQAAYHIDPEILQSEPLALRHALAALLSLTGGRSHVPGRDAMEKVMMFARQTGSGRMTASRSLLVRHKSGLFLMREHRGVRSLLVQPGERVIWDGRFHIINNRLDAVTVEPDQKARPLADCFALPPGIRAHITSILPHFPIQGEDPTVCGHVPAGIECRPVLGAYDRYMPVFDLELADALARLAGLERCLTPPV